MRSRSRRTWLSTFALALGLALALGQRTWAEVDPLASWNDGATKKAIVDFVHATTDQSSPRFVPREYAYGPANGLPDTKVGTFPQALYDQAKTEGWIVVSMKNDWKRVFGFEGLANR